MTADALKDCNKKHLAQMAKEQGISGWHAMRKDQLIRALTVTRAIAIEPGQEERADREGPAVGPQGRRTEEAIGQRRRGRGRRASSRGVRRRPPRHRRSRTRSTMPARKTGSSSWPATPTGCTPTGS